MVPLRHECWRLLVDFSKTNNGGGCGGGGIAAAANEVEGEKVGVQWKVHVFITQIHFIPSHQPNARLPTLWPRLVD